MTPKKLHKAITGWTFENFSDCDAWSVASELLLEAIKLIPAEKMATFEDACRDHLSLEDDETLEEGCQLAS